MSDLTPAQWREVELKARDCQRTWGMGFPVISVELLRQIIRSSRRTNDQNALLWALYGDAIKLGGEALGGWTTEDVHEFMLGEYHGWDKHTAFGRTRLKPKKRSSRLTKTEFAEFVDFVVRKFAEHGIVLELPGENAA